MFTQPKNVYYLIRKTLKLCFFTSFLKQIINLLKNFMNQLPGYKLGRTYGLKTFELFLQYNPLVRDSK